MKSRDACLRRRYGRVFAAAAPHGRRVLLVGLRRRARRRAGRGPTGARGPSCQRAPTAAVGALTCASASGWKSRTTIIDDARTKCRSDARSRANCRIVQRGRGGGAAWSGPRRARGVRVGERDLRRRRRRRERARDANTRGESANRRRGARRASRASRDTRARGRARARERARDRGDSEERGEARGRARRARGEACGAPALRLVGDVGRPRVEARVGARRGADRVAAVPARDLGASRLTTSFTCTTPPALARYAWPGVTTKRAAAPAASASRRPSARFSDFAVRARHLLDARDEPARARAAPHGRAVGHAAALDAPERARAFAPERGEPPGARARALLRRRARAAALGERAGLPPRPRPRARACPRRRARRGKMHSSRFAARRARAGTATTSTRERARGVARDSARRAREARGGPCSASRPSTSPSPCRKPGGPPEPGATSRKIQSP